MAKYLLKSFGKNPKDKPSLYILSIKVLAKTWKERVAPKLTIFSLESFLALIMF